MKRIGLTTLVLAFFTGCNGDSGSSGPTGPFKGKYPIQAVVTTGMVADLVRNVGGEHVQIRQIMNDGIDPHQYKATPGDMKMLAGADAIFYSGLHLEGKMVDALERLARKTPCVAVADHLDSKKVLHDEEKSVDPHVWFDVTLWSEAAGAVAKKLVEFDPKHADDYRKNLERYQAELATLDSWAKQELATIPAERRVLVTSHDAFQYFGKAYGIEVRGIQGISTEAEASLRDVSELVSFLAQRKVKAVFVESSVSPRNMQALIEGCKAKGHPVILGGELFSDAMGPAGTPEGTYVGMIRHNVNTVTKALR